jgi:hypothetical protein
MSWIIMNEVIIKGEIIRGGWTSINTRNPSDTPFALQLTRSRATILLHALATSAVDNEVYGAEVMTGIVLNGMRNACKNHLCVLLDVFNVRHRYSLSVAREHTL